MSDRKKKYALFSPPLGVGGQAEVFKARNKETGEIVALKRVLRNEDESIARLRREIEVQSILKHPNVMPVLDASTNFHWYTMPLATKILGKFSLPIDDHDLIQIVEATVAGLADAHAQGFVHRDLTPNNILQVNHDTANRWVISDWGLVRAYGRTTIVRTMPNQSFGTAGFAAPELWDDAHTADGRADIYSLGRIVAWAVTGRWPKPNFPLIPTGIWQQFVTRTTTLETEHRVQDLPGVSQLLAQATKGSAMYSKNDDAQSKFPIRIEVNKHEAIIEDVTEVVVALNDVSIERTASFTIKLPNQESQQFSSVPAGYMWKFERRGVKYQMTLLAPSYIKQQAKLEIRPDSDV